VTKPFSIKRYSYTIFALILLILCWEYNLSNAALAQSVIPEESIRLRILANSDAPEDQWIKRKIRDEVVKHMNEWVQEPGSIIEARSEVESRLPEFDRLVGEVLRSYGFQYTYSVELGRVDFPTKMYGSQVYPAGQYEALRVSLGEGEGQNWWCVLFPPLCFVDLASGEAVAEVDAANTSVDGEKPLSEDKEVKFFLWEMIKQIFGFLKGLFT
jgi:stage II sporulation protein R